MTYITFESDDNKCSTTAARALAYRTAVQQRQLGQNGYYAAQEFFRS